MKKTITALCLAGATAWVMTAGTQAQSSTSEKPEKNAKKTMTVTGCVQEGMTPGTYELTNVSGGSDSWSSSSSGTSGTSATGTSGSTSGTMSGQSGSGTSMDNIELVATRGVELKTHVGHKVQVTGTMDTKDSKQSSSGTSGSGTSGSGSTSGSGMSGQSGSMGSHTGMEHKFHVQSLKMLSETCTGQ